MLPSTARWQQDEKKLNGGKKEGHDEDYLHDPVLLNNF